MSEVIDSRVVEMKFDNAQFASGVNESLTLLEKLEQKLHFKNEKNTFDGINESAKKVDLSPITDGVQTVAIKFDELYTIGTRALERLTDSAIDAGTRIAKSLSVDQISAGWSKYADKTSAVQTIMSATAKDFTDTGKQMEYVNSQIEKLNWFTDETSFNFLDMVNSIGKFTSNNIKLEAAVTSMEGISTWAAASGATINEAGRAMYNLSQAISMGSVKLMDWRSIELANMGTAEFKQQVLESAESLGTLQKVGDDTWQTLEGDIVSVTDFSSNLAKGWFSSDVLIDVLNKYGGFTDELNKGFELTGLTATEMLDDLNAFREGTLDIKEVSDETGVSVAELTTMFQNLNKEEYKLGEKAFRAAQEAKTFTEAINSVKDAVSTGWMQSFEYIFGDYQQAKKLWTTVAEELYDVFAEGGNARNELLKEWSKTAEGGRDTFISAIGNMWDNVKVVIENIKGAFSDIFPPITTEKLVEFTNKFYELTEKFKMSEETASSLNSIFKGFFSVFDIIGQAIGSVLKLLQPFFSAIGSGAKSVIRLLGQVGDSITGLAKKLRNDNFFENKLQGVFEFSQKVMNGVWNTMQPIFSAILEKAKGIPDILKQIGTSIDETFTKLTGKSIGTALQDLGKTISDFFVNLPTNAQKAWGVLKNFFEGMPTFLSGVADKVKSIIEKIKEFFSTVFTKDEGSFLDDATSYFQSLSESFGNAAQNVSGATSGIIETIKKFIVDIKSYIGDTTPQSLADILTSILGFTTLGELKKNIKAWTGVANTLSGTIKQFGSVVIQPFGAIVTAFNGVIDQYKKNQKHKALASMVLEYSVSLGIITMALSKLSDIKDTDKLKTSAITLGVALGAMVALSVIVSKSADKIKNTKNINAVSGEFIAMALSLYIVGKRLAELANFPWEQTTAATVGMAALVVAMGTMIKFIAHEDDLLAKNDFLGTSLAFISMSLAVSKIAKAMEGISSIDTEKIGQSIVGISVIFLGMFALLKAVPKQNVGVNIASIGAMALGITILAEAIKSIGNIDTQSAVKGFAGITAIIAELLIAVRLIPKDTSNLSGFAITVVAVSASMVVFAKAVKDFGSLDTGALVKGVGGIGALFLAIAAASKLVPKNNNFLDFAIGFVAIAAGLRIINGAVKEMESIKWGDIAKLIAEIAGVYGSITLLSALGNKLGASLSLKDGGAFMMIAVGLRILSPAIKEFMEIPMGKFAALCGILVGAITLLTTVSAAVVYLFGPAAAAIGNLAKGISKLVSTFINAIAALGLIVAAIDFFGIDLDAFFGRLNDILIVVGKWTERITASIMGILTGIVLGIAEALPELGMILIDAVMLFADMLMVQLDMKVAQTVAGQLLSFFASIGLAVGAAWAVSKLAPKVGDGMRIFAENIQPFMDSVKAIDPECVTGAENLIKVLDSLRAAAFSDMIDDIFDIGDNRYEKFGKKLSDLSSGIKDICKAFSGTQGLDIGPALTAIAVLVTALENVFTEDWRTRLNKIFSGTNPLETLVGKLEPVMDTIKKMSKEITDVHVDNLAKVVPILDQFADIAEKIVGIKTKFDEAADEVVPVVDEDISVFQQFSTDLYSLAPALVSFIEQTAGVTEDSVAGSSRAIIVLADAAKTLAGHGGTLQDVVGDSSLVDFATELQAIGPALSAYVDDVAGITEDDVKSSAMAIRTLSYAADTVPKRGGLAETFQGENDLEKFAKELETFGDSLKKYVNTVKEIPDDDLSRGTDIVTYVTDLCLAWRDLFVYEDGLSMPVSFSASMDLIRGGGEMVKDVCEDWKDVNLEDLSNVCDTISGTTEAISKLSFPEIETVPENYSKSFRRLGAAAKSFNKAIRGMNFDEETLSNATSTLAKVIGATNRLKSAKEAPNYSAFSSQLSDLGKNIKTFASNISGFDTSAPIAEAANAIADVAGAFANLPHVSEFAGLQYLITSDLATYGGYIKDFAGSVAGIDTSGVFAAAVAIVEISKAAAQVPTVTEVSDSTGQAVNKFKSFVDSIKEALPSFIDVSKDLVDNNISGNAKNFEAFAGVIERFAEIKMPEKGGFFDWFTGHEITFTDFTSDMATAGENIGNMAKNLSGVSAAKLTSAAALIESFIEVANSLSTITYEEIDITPFTTFVDNISADLSPEFAEKLNSIPQFDTSGIISLQTAIGTVKGLAATITVNDISTDGSESNLQRLKSFVSELPGLSETMWKFTIDAKKVNADDITDFTTAFTPFINLAQTIAELDIYKPVKPEANSEIYEENGKSNISAIKRFINDVSRLGDTLSDFGKSMYNVDFSLIEKAGDSITVLIGFASSVNDLKGYKNEDSRTGGLTNFANDISNLGPAIRSIVRNLNGIDTSGITNSKASVETIIGFAKSLSEINSYSVNWTDGGKGVISHFAEDLSVEADGTSKLASAFKSFSEGLSGVDLSDVTKNKNAIDTIIGFAKDIHDMYNGGSTSAAGFLSKTVGNVTSALGHGAIANFSKDIAALGPELKSYSTVLKDFDSASVTNSKAGTSAIIEIVKSISEISAYASDKNISALTNFVHDIGGKGYGTDSSIVSFVEFIEEYSTHISGFDAQTVTGTTEAVKGLIGVIGAISELSAYATENPIKPITNLTADLAGIGTVKTTVDEVGKAGTEIDANAPDGSTVDSAVEAIGNVTTLGGALAQYASELEGVKVSNITGAQAATEGLISIAKSINEMSAYTTEHSDDHHVFPIEAFKDDLKTLSGTIKNYASTFEGVNTKKIEEAKPAIQVLVDLAKDINEIDVYANGTGIQMISAFAEEIAPLASALGDFSMRSGEINVEKIVKANEAITVFSNLATNISSTETGIGKASSLIQFSTGIIELGKALADYSAKVGEVSTDNINLLNGFIDSIVASVGSNSDKLNTFASAFQNAAGNGITSFINAFLDSMSNVESAVDTMLGCAETTANGFGLDEIFMQIATTCVSAFSGGLTAGQGQIHTAASGLLEAAKSAFANITGDFTAIGNYIIDGLVAGINGSKQRVFDAVAQLAKDIPTTAQVNLDIGSPSKVMENEVGRFVGLGLAKGIEKSSPDVEDATEGLVYSIIDTGVATRLQAQFDAVTAEYESFISGISNMSEALSIINDSMLEKLNNVAVVMSGIFALIPEDLIADHGLSVFGQEIIIFGDSIRTFFKSIAMFPPDLLDYILYVVKKLIATMEDAARADITNLDRFIEAMLKFANVTSVFSDVDIQAITDIVGSMDLMVDTIKRIGDTADAIDVNAFEKLSSIFRDGFGNFSGIDISGAFDEFASSIENFSASLSGIDFSSVFSGLTTALSSAVSMLESSVSELSSTLVGAIDNMATAIAAAVTAGGNLVISAAKSLAETAKSALSEIANSMASSGANIGAAIAGGIASGIAQGSGAITSAATTVSGNALTAARDALDINSPSKVMEKEIGNNIDLGIAVGIAKKTKEVTKASEKLGKSVIASMKKSLGIHSPSKEAEKVGDKVGEGFWKGVASAMDENGREYTEVLMEDGSIQRIFFDNMVAIYGEAGKDAGNAFNDGLAEAIKQSAPAEGEKFEYRTGFFDFTAYEKAKEHNAIRFDSYDEEYEFFKSFKDTLKAYGVLTSEEEFLLNLGWREYVMANHWKFNVDQSVVDEIEKEIIESGRNAAKDNPDYHLVLADWFERLAKPSYDYGDIIRGDAFTRAADDERKAFANSQSTETSSQKDPFKENLETEKYYNRLTVKEELDAWKERRDATAEGSEERKEAEKQIYTLTKKYIEGNVDLIHEEIEANRQKRASMDESSKEYSDSLKYESELLKMEADAMNADSEAWIQNEIARGRMIENSWEHYNALARIRDRQEKDSEEWEKYDLDMFNVRMNLIDGDIDATQEWIDELIAEMETLDENSIEYQNAAKLLDILIGKKHEYAQADKEEALQRDKDRNMLMEGSTAEYEKYIELRDAEIEGSEKWVEYDDKAYAIHMGLIEKNVTEIDKEIAKENELIAALEEGSEEWKRHTTRLVYLSRLRSDAWLDEEVAYNRLEEGSQEYIDALLYRQSLLEKGSAEWLDLDREIYAARMELISDNVEAIKWEIVQEEALLAAEEAGSEAYEKRVKQIAYLNRILLSAQYNDSKQWIEDEKFYGRLSKQDEIDAWNRVLARYEENTNEYKEISKTIYTLQNELADAEDKFHEDTLSAEEEYQEKMLDAKEKYADKRQEINDKLQNDIEEANKRYEDALQSRADTIRNSYKIFDEVEKKKPVKASKLFDNLRGQVEALNDWRNDLNALTSRALPQSLIDELRELGPDAAAEIKALNSLSDHELTEYVELWLEKSTLANEQATLEMQSMREDVDAEIAGLRKDAEAELKDAKREYYNELDTLREETDAKLEGIKNTYLDSIGELKKEAKPKVDEVAEQTVGQFKKMGEDTNEAVSGEFGAMVGSIVADTSNQDNWKPIGVSMIEGIVSGLLEMAPTLYDTVYDIMEAAKETAQFVLDIHSPSRVFEDMGENVDKGFALGIGNFASSVINSVKRVGYSVIDAMSYTVNRASLCMAGDMDYEPVIRPVYDLSGVNSNAAILDIFGAGTSAAISLSLGSSGKDICEDIGELKNATVDANGKVVDAIGALQSEVSELAASMREMRLVMDTGALVGAISPDVDKSLGRIAFMKRRGV